MIDSPRVLSEEPTAVTPHGGICGGESQQWLSYPTKPHVRFDERGGETGHLAMPQATALFVDSTTNHSLWPPFVAGAAVAPPLSRRAVRGDDRRDRRPEADRVGRVQVEFVSLFLAGTHD
jgi:hypothetical protein